MVTCGYLRQNIIEDVWADIFGVAQSTISRYITFLTPFVEKAAEEDRPTAEDAAEATRGVIALVDGTLWPCWSWNGENKLWSGKYKTTGHGSLIVTNLQGHITFVSDPVTGNEHDMAKLKRSDAEKVLKEAGGVFGDKGFIGTDYITTPIVSKQLLSVVAIIIAGAVIFGLTLITAMVRKSISKRRTRRYLNEERALIVEIRQALEIVERDLAPSSQISGSLNDDIDAVNDLVAQIRATSGIHSFAVSVADYVRKNTLGPQEPEASLDTVIGAKVACDQALAGYAHLERGLESRGGWLKHRVRHTEPQPETTRVMQNPGYC